MVKAEGVLSYVQALAVHSSLFPRMVRIALIFEDALSPIPWFLLGRMASIILDICLSWTRYVFWGCYKSWQKVIASLCSDPSSLHLSELLCSDNGHSETV